MGRHEIRLRRKRMTSRRIESHKNYYALLRKHERSGHGKLLLKLFISLIILLIVMFLAYYGLQKLEAADKNDQVKNDQAYYSAKFNLPACFDIYFHLNTNSYGKT